MVKRTLSLDGLTGPVTLHLQSLGAFAGAVQIIADPAIIYPRFILPDNPKFEEPILDTQNGHVYLTFAASSLATPQISPNDSAFPSGKDSVSFIPKDMSSTADHSYNEQPEGRDWMTAYLPANSSVIANLREPVMAFVGLFDKIDVSLLDGQLGISGSFKEADARVTCGLIYVREVPSGSILTTSTGDAQIHVRSFCGRGYLNSVSGNVRIDSADPEPHADTTTPTLQITTMTGNVIYTPASPEAARRISVRPTYGTVNGEYSTQPPPRRRSAPSMPHPGSTTTPPAGTAWPDSRKPPGPSPYR